MLSDLEKISSNIKNKILKNIQTFFFSFSLVSKDFPRSETKEKLTTKWKQEKKTRHENKMKDGKSTVVHLTVRKSIHNLSGGKKMSGDPVIKILWKLVFLKVHIKKSTKTIVINCYWLGWQVQFISSERMRKKKRVFNHQNRFYVKFIFKFSLQKTFLIRRLYEKGCPFGGPKGNSILLKNPKLLKYARRI